ncbi:MAG: hypothetical protein CMI18_02145 [Opitutaceae bacterium]|nr:hypothetical protein [Opitutaceae bacterium]
MVLIVKDPRTIGVAESSVGFFRIKKCAVNDWKSYSFTIKFNWEANSHARLVMNVETNSKSSLETFLEIVVENKICAPFSDLR